MEFTGQIQFDFEAPSFFDTINCSVEDKAKFVATAKSQEGMVLEVLNFTKVTMAWFEVQGFLKDMNRESLKRSLSVLKKKGKLIKTNFLVMGPEGKECHRYELIKPIN